MTGTAGPILQSREQHDSKYVAVNYWIARHCENQIKISVPEEANLNLFRNIKNLSRESFIVHSSA